MLSRAQRMARSQASPPSEPTDVTPEPADVGDVPEHVLDHALEEIVRLRVRRAAEAYRDGKPGRAEYELVRMGLAIARHARDAETIETLAALRFTHVRGADQ